MSNPELLSEHLEYVPGAPYAGTLEPMLATHASALEEIATIYDSSQEIYYLNAPDRIDYTIETLLQIDPEHTLRSTSRRAAHAHRKAGYIDSISALGFLWAARVGIAVANGKDLESVEAELPTVITGVPTSIITMVRAVAAGEIGNYERLERNRPVILDDLHSALDAQRSSPAEVFGWLAGCDMDLPVNRGLLLLLQHERGIRSSEGGVESSILFKALEAFKDLPSEHFLLDFIKICEATPDNYYRETKLFGFLKAFAQLTTQDELQQRLLATRGSWPEDLQTSLDKYVETVRYSLSVRIKSRLELMQFWEINPTLEDLESGWQNVLAVLPDEFLGRHRSRHDQIMARVATKRKSSPRPVDQSEPGKDGEEDEKEPPIKRQLNVLKLTPSNVYVFDTNPQAVERMISEHVAKYPGVGGLEEQIRAAVNYLQTTRIPKGVKKFDNNTLRIEGDNSHAQIPLQSFKPTPDTGLQGSRIFRKTRIEFVWLDNEQIGLRNIHLRDDKVSSRRKKA